MMEKNSWKCNVEFFECENGPYVMFEEAQAALASKDAEIDLFIAGLKEAQERHKKDVSEIERLRRAFTLMGSRLAAVRTILSSPMSRVERECTYEEMCEILKILHSALAAAPEHKPETCVWKFSVTGIWRSECGYTFVGYEPANFCYQCGKCVEVRG
jgi:hypothetical protein